MCGMPVGVILGNIADFVSTLNLTYPNVPSVTITRESMHDFLKILDGKATSKDVKDVKDVKDAPIGVPVRAPAEPIINVPMYHHPVFWAYLWYFHF